MEAVLLHNRKPQKLPHLDPPRTPRVGGRVRHPETTAFGPRKREPNPDDRGTKVVVFTERVVFDDPDFEVGSGHAGVG